MPEEITMPQLSDTMTEGTLVRWLKAEGDAIREGENIAEIETDKATMELESFESGVLAVRAVAEGSKAAVGAVVAVLATAGEDVAAIKKKYAAGAASAPAKASESAPAKAEAAETKTEVKQQAASTAKVGTSSPKGGATAVAEPPPTHTNGRESRLRVSPLARRMAEEQGIDLSRIKGSGPGGRIVKQDLAGGRAAATAAPTPEPAKEKAPATPSAAPAAASPALPARVASGQKETIELTKMRATIAQRLQQSKQTVPHFYETIDIDLEALVALRQRLNETLEKQKVRLSIADFLAKAVAAALKRHPAVNATFDGNAITRYGDVNLGIAVALDDGLIVPVLRGVDQMGLAEIRQRTADLVDRARAQRLKREELSGATFTVSNLGNFGIREFSAIVNPPEVGILAIGTAEPRAVVRNGQIVARTMMTVTLSADHRAVDGATAAAFLATLRSLLEEPGMMLV